MPKNQTPKTTAAQTPTGLPMFYRTPMCVDIGRHAQAGLLPMTHCKFAANTNSIPINISEFVQAAKQYPIVFTLDETPMPAIITGIENDNYFVDGAGQWRMDFYVPDYVRKYPFILLHVPESNQFVLCVDEAAEQFCEKKTKGAEPFYDAEGQPTELAKSAFSMAINYQQHYAMTEAFTRAIKEADLLVSNTSTVTLANDRVIRLGGFQMIDEARFNALSDATILEFHKKGWLPLIHFALLSASNWKRIADLASLNEDGKQ